MGHLIDMMDALNLLVLVSHQFRALVESNLSETDATEWQTIINPTDGHLVIALKAQKSFLGGIDPNQAYTYEASISKDFPDENYASDYYNDIDPNSQNSVDDLISQELFETRCRNLSAFNNDLNNDENWSAHDLKYNFDFTNNVFSDELHGDDDDADIFAAPVKDFPTQPKNDTDWADFDSHFSEFQISDNKTFPLLESSNGGGGAREDGDVGGNNEAGAGDTSNSNQLNDDGESTAAASFPCKKTFAEVTASNPWDNVIKIQNNINSWPSQSLSTTANETIVDSNDNTEEKLTNTITETTTTTSTTSSTSPTSPTAANAEIEDKL